MEYSKIKDFDKYKSVFDHKVAQLRRPQERQALVIFFDGKNATKHHNHDMLSRESFTRWMVRSIRSILRGYQSIKLNRNIIRAHSKFMRSLMRLR